MVWLAAGSAGAQFIPRHCGMRAGAESYGSLSVGSTIVLGMHTPWAGDANWDPGMQRFVGLTAVVTQYAGVDSAGCPGVRVNVDGGQWFWRIRDAQIMGGGGGGVYGEPLPRSCGMVAGRESYGVVRAGSQIVLGRHTPWGADDNWDPQMMRFVGMLAIVTSLDGVDSAGCPGVRVNVDGGQWFWRLRDATLGGGYGGGVVIQPPPPPPVIPTWCGMASGGEQYGPVTIGAWVILGMHTPWNGDANWTPEMSRWVGQRAQVTQLGGVDSAGCPGVRVSADGGQYFWRIRDMRM
jgi:hypothetical protein